MGAEIDPKVEMDLSTFEIGGWNTLQLSNRKLLEEFVEEAATVALHIGIRSRDPSLVMHYVKELMFPRDGLREMMQRYRRQHLLPVPTCMNTQEDIHRGRNLRG